MRTDISIVIDSIEKACDDIGDLDLSGVKLENPKPTLLDIQDGNFDEHVAMQPAAIAYYGMLMKHARRELNAQTLAYEHWRKKTFQIARQALAQPVGGKPPAKSTISDIESYIFINYEADVKKWEEDIVACQARFDVIESWYDAWKQKGFSLREISGQNRDEYNSRNYMSKPESHEVVVPVIKRSKPNNETFADCDDLGPAPAKIESAFDRVKRIQRRAKGGTV